MQLCGFDGLVAVGLLVLVGLGVRVGALVGSVVDVSVGGISVGVLVGKAVGVAVVQDTSASARKTKINLFMTALRLS
jgi:hypothetical protein